MTKLSRQKTSHFPKVQKIIRSKKRPYQVKKMASVLDVAHYILGLCKKDNVLPITTWKLQKLVYYSQAWAVVWDDTPIFENRIEAWANGPVCPDLYKVHKGSFKISSVAGKDSAIDASHKETIKIVYKYYGEKTPQYLSELTHQEQPWKKARKGLNPGERGNKEITLESMAEYYGSL